jgi:hypothetical protein
VANERDGGSWLRKLDDPQKKYHIRSVNIIFVGADMRLIGASSTVSCAAAAPVTNFLYEASDFVKSFPEGGDRSIRGVLLVAAPSVTLA